MYAYRFIRVIATVALPLAASLAHAFGEPIASKMQAQDWAGEGIAFCVPPPPTNPPG
jgi:hypothetical protein